MTEPATTPAPSATAAHLHRALVDLDDNSFFNALGGHLTIVDFWAPWCGPCTLLHPMFDAHAAAHTDLLVQFVRVNVDDSPGVASAYTIMSIPTIIVFDTNGREVDREIGLPSKRRFDQLVRNAGALAAASSSRGAA